MAISAVAGMRTSTVSACTTSSAAPLRAPATPYSGWKSLSHAAQRQRRHGRKAEDCLERPTQRARLVPVDRLSWPVSIITPARSAALTITPVRPNVVDAGLRIVVTQMGQLKYAETSVPGFVTVTAELVNPPARHDVTTDDHHDL